MGNNLEARARALAEKCARGSLFGNAERHADLTELMKRAAPNDPMPRLMTETELLAYVEEMWPFYAQILTGEISDNSLLH